MNEIDLEKYLVLARKYRPASFSDLIGQETLVRTLTNAFIADRIAQAFMLTGIRGTGKTTTIINIIQEWQQKFQESRNGMVIHLNASDERGIDIIRNQIYQFVHSKNMFEKGIKFVILDIR